MRTPTRGSRLSSAHAAICASRRLNAMRGPTQRGTVFWLGTAPVLKRRVAMVWLVVAVVVAVLLVGAWLFDRRWDMNPSADHGQAQASSDQAWTATRDHSGGSL